MRAKPKFANYKGKFDKSRCATCEYVFINSSITYCSYATHGDDTCLFHNKATGELVDRRGDDYNNCKLYKRDEIYHRGEAI